MGKSFDRLANAAREAAAIARGAAPAYRIWHTGWPYVSETAWQPIATHPRDGKQFLAVDARYGIFHACFAWGDDLIAWSEIEGQKLFNTATHWMPLPPPPNA